MNIKDLEIKWSNLKVNPDMYISFIRIDEIAIPELNIGINSDRNRCLVLELPKTFKINIKSIHKQNISLEYLNSQKYLLLILTDDSYLDLFNALIASLYLHITKEDNPDNYSLEFIRIFHKWSSFFNENGSGLLSKEAVKGFFGELLILSSFLSETNSLKVNDVLKSWRGPYDERHDFILDDKNLEIKTKESSKIEIRISSEYQLEKESGKNLELVVVSVTENPVDGTSLYDMVNNIKELVFQKQGDLSIFIKALLQKGLSFNNIKEYDNIRFVAVEQISYDCVCEDFPKIIKSNINESISKVGYSLRVNTLKAFILSKKRFLNGN